MQIWSSLDTSPSLCWWLRSTFCYHTASLIDTEKFKFDFSLINKDAFLPASLLTWLSIQAEQLLQCKSILAGAQFPPQDFGSRGNAEGRGCASPQSNHRQPRATWGELMRWERGINTSLSIFTRTEGPCQPLHSLMLTGEKNQNTTVIQTIFNNVWQHSKYAKANQVGIKYPNIKIPITLALSAQDI